MPAMTMLHEVDPRDDLLAKLGDLSGIDLFHNQVLLAVYKRPRNVKTKAGIYLPDQHLEEDNYQSKVGLLVKAGPGAFEADGKWFDWESKFVVGHDWLVFRPSDTWQITVKNTTDAVLCRVCLDVDIRGRVSHPDMVW